MTTKFNPDMLTLARERQGLSQSALARRCEITQATVSRYESGIVEPSIEHVETLAKVLDRPIEFFFLEQQVYGASAMFHRKKQTPIRELSQITAHVNEIRIHATALLNETQIETDYRFHRLDTTCASPSELALQLRCLWQLPPGPIRSVVSVIERAGGIVFRCNFRGNRIDGISQWPLDAGEFPPVFFVNDGIPGDRARFTLAHEIGHVVLHHLPATNPERDADQFASEFLMPSNDIADDLKSITLKKASALKSKWKVSMAALIRKARSLEIIDQLRYENLMTELSRLGYRKCEPVSIPNEDPKLFSTVLSVHRKELGRSFADLSQMLGIYEHHFIDQFLPSINNLRVVRR